MEGRSIDVLLVEDNAADVFLTTEAFKLGTIPTEIHVVGDGEAALDYLFARGRYKDVTFPDLVLLDLNLPRRDGREVLAEIKGDPILRHIPVIILSTSRADADVINAYEKHANCYLTKPTDVYQYFDLIREVEQYWLNMVCLPA
ncbi:MAG TPA: response regulator [Bryobacteraceae bacterium]|nr:response regulator [Bryobacteraceae bacterium]